jgi:hypothetical protein
VACVVPRSLTWSRYRKRAHAWSHMLGVSGCRKGAHWQHTLLTGICRAHAYRCKAFQIMGAKGVHMLKGRSGGRALSSPSMCEVHCIATSGCCSGSSRGRDGMARSPPLAGPSMCDVHTRLKMSVPVLGGLMNSKRLILSQTPTAFSQHGRKFVNKTQHKDVEKRCSPHNRRQPPRPKVQKQSLCFERWRPEKKDLGCCSTVRAHEELYSRETQTALSWYQSQALH